MGYKKKKKSLKTVVVGLRRFSCMPDMAALIINRNDKLHISHLIGEHNYYYQLHMYSPEYCQ